MPNQLSGSTPTLVGLRPKLAPSGVERGGVFLLVFGVTSEIEWSTLNWGRESLIDLVVAHH